MEIKEGMYIRTKEGLLGKVKKIEDEEYLIITSDCFGSKDGDNWYALYELDGSKASYNIIDLIKIRDMVNGEVIERIYRSDDVNNYFIEAIDMRLYTNNDIKTILTHEQIKQYEYIVI